MLKLRTEELDWREIDRDIVILDGRDASYFTVNGSGALLWRTLATGATRDALVNLVLEAYDTDAVTATADVEAFVRTLCERGFLAG